MGYNKGHMEFTTLNLKEGLHNVPGYPPGFSEKILAGSLDEKNKRGNRTRMLRIEAGAFSTKPFVHEYWEEVFLLSGDLVVGNDEHGKGGEQFRDFYQDIDRQELVRLMAGGRELAELEHELEALTGTQEA